MVEVTTDGLVDQPTATQLALTAQWAAAAGSVNAITGAYPIPNTTLPDGLILGFRASGANTSNTPTFSPDGLTPHTIVKMGGAALQLADIPAAKAEMLVRYNLAQTRWELLNPAISRLPSRMFAVAGGSADVLTATFTPAFGPTLADGTLVAVRTPSANATATPTLSVDGTAAVQIANANGSNLLIGDLAAGQVYIFVYQSSGPLWACLNPSRSPSAGNWGSVTGTSDALVLGLNGTLISAGLVDGLQINFRATALNQTTTPTLNVNSLGAKTITRFGGGALVSGDLQANGEYIVRYNLASTRWELANPSNITMPWGVMGGTAQVQTLSLAFSYILYDGFTFGARCTTANTGAAPTLSVNGSSALTIVKRFATALIAGDMAAGGEYIFRYNAANTRWVLLNPVVN